MVILLSKIFVGDIGTKLKFDIGVDISNVISAKIYYRKPDGTTGSWTVSLEAPTYVYYITQNGDIDTAGTWKFQVYVELASGWKGRGETVTIEVYEVI